MRHPSRTLAHRMTSCAALTFAILFASSALAAPRPDTPSTSPHLIPVAARRPAPKFTISGVQGKTISLAQFRGKVVLLDFWAVDCGGCKIEIPWYVQFRREYHARGLDLIGLDMYGESPAMIRAFMVKAHMDYPVAVGTDAIGKQFGVTALPMTLLIDRQGRIAAAHTGIVNRAEFASDIRVLLTNNQPLKTNHCRTETSSLPVPSYPRADSRSRPCCGAR
jgi:peroxiredoxin